VRRSEVSVPGTADERFSALADDFIERKRLGQNPSVDAYAAAHPELADEITLAFPSQSASARPRCYSRHRNVGG
jgi:hypothetical protein